jgi:hypothetical protein
VTIRLGQIVRDKVSGFKGVAVSEHTYLNGCSRFTIQPLVDKEGKLPDTQTFDEPQLEFVGESCLCLSPKKTDNGGPMPYVDRGKSIPSRR